MGFLEYLDNIDENELPLEEVSLSEARKILKEAREEYLKETKTVFTPDMIDKLITECENTDVIEALEQFKEIKEMEISDES